MTLNELKSKFNELYSKDSVNVSRIFFSPGRVNLIGEHIDYNGGYVFPCALNIGTYAVVRRRDDNIIRLSSLNFDKTVECNKNKIEYKKEDGWANYPKGVAKFLLDSGYNFKGMDILYYGNLPNGAGLSSSASIEILTGEIINTIFNQKISKIELVKISQRAESEFIGVKCGIMDQFACGMGKKSCAIYLDCNTLYYKYAKLDMKEYNLIIVNSNKKRALTDSKYNERRSECESALKKIKTKLNVNQLADISPKSFEDISEILTDKNELKRTRHVVYENQRTKDGFEAILNNDIEKFGKLMNSSHISLRDDYEVTGIELYTLVEEAWKISGCVGARMTGAGFGGCTVNIVKENCIKEFKKIVGNNYKEKTGGEADFYLVNISDGAKEITAS